jgi:glycosyltransferase involved in cell wall biosynthesis
VDISVVIPLYNKAPHIQRALNSILSQTFQAKEIIVVDDGSTDGGGEIVKAYPDACIKLIRQDNSGAAAARNRGICEASSDFIAFLDADDEWKPEHLQKIALLIEEYPECGAYATSFEEDAGSAKIWRPKPQKNNPIGWKGRMDFDRYLELSITTYTFLPSSTCFRKNTFNRAGMFDPKVGLGQDHELWIRIFLVTDFAFLNEPLMVHYLNAVNRYRDIVNYNPSLGIFLEKIEQLMMDNTLPAKTRQLLYESYCHFLLMRIPVALRNGYRDYARDYLRKSSKTQKFKLRWFKWYLLTIVPSRLSVSYLNRWISRG